MGDYDFEYNLTGPVTTGPSAQFGDGLFSFGPGFDSLGGNLGAATQLVGSVSVPQAPNPSDVMGSWTDGLAAFTKAATGVFGLATTFTQARAQAHAISDAAAIARDDRAFNQFARTADLDLKRQQIASSSELGKLSLTSATESGKLNLAAQTELGKINLASQLARARDALPQNSVFYPIVSGTAPASSYVVLALLAIGGLWLYKKAKHA